MAEEEAQSPAGRSGEPRLGRSERQLVAVMGGKGGIGTSIVAVNLAVYLAQLGRKVILIDSNSSGAQLHTMLGVTADTSDNPEGELHLVATSVPGLSLAPQSYSRDGTVPARPGRKARWAGSLRQLEADHVILDLGAGTQSSTLDLFGLADLGVMVTTPEPPSIEGIYRLLAALFIRRLKRTLIKDRFQLRLVERAQAELAPLPRPLELVRAIARYDSRAGEGAALELSRLRPRLIVNLVRLKHDSELGPAMVEVARRHLGVELDYAGQIEDDDAAWLSIVKRQPLLTHAPASKSARNLERIARRLLAVATARESVQPRVPVTLTAEEPTLYDILLTHPSASDEELRRAHKRQREIYRSDSLSLTSLISPAELGRAQARLDEAYDILIDPQKRRSYDLSTFPQAPRPSKHPPEVGEALAAERQLLSEELARELTIDTVFTGKLLRKVREAKGIELEDIRERTKISRSHLVAIEEEQYATLPASVYLRGFLGEIAKFLGLDPARVTRSYLARHRAWRKGEEERQ